MTLSDDPAAFRAVRRSELESVTRTEELSILLAQEYARADVSLRELEARANRAGGARLARATCSDMLAGRRFPKKAVMVAFLRACQVPEDQLPEWERAWERTKIAQISAAPPYEGGQNVATLEQSVSDSEENGATSKTRPVRNEPAGRWKLTGRRVGLAAGLAAATSLIAVAGVFALTDSSAPAQRIITDDGRAFGRGGSSRFVVTINPANTRVRLTRRLDAGIGMQTATVTVDRALAAVWQPLHPGPHGWKDQHIILPPALTMGRRRLTITNTFVSSQKDFNEFTYLIDQEVNGVWSRADTVDIGPYHTDSEAEHHYRIINETWADANPFTYLE